jgi:Mce-associated membrane protein
MSEAAATDTSPTVFSYTDPKSGQPTADAEPEAADAETAEATDHDAAADDEVDDADHAVTAKNPASHVRLATVAGVTAGVVLAALVGWLGFRAYQSHHAQQQRELIIKVGRQGALNLTTIDWQHADTDVKRILDSATGSFYDDFSSRQQPFIDVVKKAHSNSVGTINEAGLESESGDQAVVMVALSIKTSNLGAAEQEPRAWRMRISVKRNGDEAKVSNVQFVP